MAEILARLTRVSENYLQELEEEPEPQGPPKLTKAQKKAAKKEAKRLAMIEEKRLIMRVGSTNFRRVFIKDEPKQILNIINFYNKNNILRLY